MQTMVGYCSSCGAQIIDLTKQGKDRFLPNFTQHTIELSNGTLMAVGVCSDCKVKLVGGKNVQATADTIVGNHKIYWAVQDEGMRPKDFVTITATDPNTSYEKWYNKKILKAHADHVKKLKQK